MATFQIGSKGNAVEQLQRNLNELRFNCGRADGDFGRKTKRALAAFQQAYLVDGIADDVTKIALEAAVTVRHQSDLDLVIPRPNGLAEITEMFGAILWDEADGGNIIITNGWDDQNIVRATFPITGVHLVHKKMEPVFHVVLEELKDRGLDGEIKQFGTYSPRHKMHNPKRSLSTHSWGIACDVNQATNAPGRRGDLNPEIVVVFEKHGFEWGGRWKNPDDMHFQYCKGF